MAYRWGVIKPRQNQRPFTSRHMPQAKLQAATLGGTPDEVEATFYEALQMGNLERLMSCWADEDDVICVHPGGPRAVGPAAIRASFEVLFSNGPIQARPDQIRKVDALASAMHSLVERIAVLTPEGPREAWVLATNVYHKTAQGWRMVAHHASPGTPHDALDVVATPAVLH
jgi:ketosteroid isomerase-like protein